MMTMEVKPTPKVASYKDGGSSKLDVVPFGGGMTGMSSGICWPAMIQKQACRVRTRLLLRPEEVEVARLLINLKEMKEEDKISKEGILRLPECKVIDPTG